MEDYTVLSECTLKCELPVEEVRERFRAFVNSKSEETRLYLESYGFEAVGSDCVAVEMVDYCAKHYRLYDLAEFISTVIKPNSWTCLVLDSGLLWSLDPVDAPTGYLVMHREVRSLQFEPVVVSEGMTLSRFLNERR